MCCYSDLRQPVYEFLKLYQVEQGLFLKKMSFLTLDMRWASPVVGRPAFLTRLIRGSALSLSLWASPLAENSLQGLSPNFNNLKQRERRNKGKLNLFAGIILSRSLVVSQSICPSVSLSAAQPYFFFLDVDDCTEMIDNCDVNAHCNNTVGSFSCTCNSGFTGNGTTCAGKYDYFVW